MPEQNFLPSTRPTFGFKIISKVRGGFTVPIFTCWECVWPSIYSSSRG
ncbi:hypothetical protein PC114_g18094 [Phytophthora cactorum]|nr:hypothetical protein PC114_g18094 [Phytophthora cactorum]